MGTTGPQLLRNPKTVSPWQATGGFKVISNLLAPAPECLYEGDNNANAKYMWLHTPKDGQNPSVSTYWETWFKLDVATDVIYFIIANQPTLQIASATIQGYAIEIDGTNSRIDIERLTGAGGLTNVTTYGWTPDTNLHKVRMAREVSGANRFWRLYYGDSDSGLALVAGPSASDAVYTNFTCWGWDHLTHNRCVCGGEACQS